MPTFVQNILKSAAPLVRKYPFLGKIIFKKVHEVFGGHIRYFFTGGAKIDPEVILRFQSLGIQMLQGYGLTETSPIISFTRVGSLKYKSVGKPLRSLQVKIHEPSVTGEGEIAVRGPSVFKGYFENPTATAEAFKDGWFHTGDLGFLDEEGYIFITGRKKDMIVTPNGKNVYPEELEELLKGSALFSEVSVLGLESGRGEAVHAVIVPVDLRSNHPKEKIWEEINRLTAGVSEYKKIQGVTVAFEELPKTPTKKVKKHLLRKMIQEGHFEKTNQGAALKNAMGSPLNANKENEKWLLEKLTEITKKTQIYKESDLKQDLGIDSLTFMEIISILEAQFRVQIPDGEFSKMILVSDLLKYTEEIHENQLPVTAQTESLSTHFDFRKNNTILMTFARLLIHGLIIRPILKIFFRFKVKDQEFINSGGSFILTPNHSSHFDLLAILSSIPLRKLKTTYAVAAEDYFFNTRLKSLFVRLVFNAIPFDRKARIEKGFTICEEILKAGGNLVIFPEGTRSPDGNLSAFKAGVGRLLAGHAYSAVPSYISGAFSILPKGGMIPKLHPLSIRFAKPVNFKQVSPDSKSYLLVAETLHHSVENLKDI
jgi:long-chain acyl-CoA synthetase